MSLKSSSVLPAPPDQSQRIAALDPNRSILVQAPAGSGKTDLLTRRFLRLLAEVDDPAQIVAITFTKAAAAEMRHRILAELEKAAERAETDPMTDETSMEALAARALDRSQKLNWRLLELVSQLRISTIDSFCRDLAIQQPIYSGVGDNLQINERPAELYRKAARATLEKLGDARHPDLSDAIRDLLLWRDNGWKELEELLVKMLGQRDRWMLDFVLSHQQDWDALRERLERPFANAVRAALDDLEQLLTDEDCEEAQALARFASAHGANHIHRELAELAEFPRGPYQETRALEDARAAYLCLANLALTGEGKFRTQVDRRLGFPKEHRDEKLRLEDLIDHLSEMPGLEEALAGTRTLPPARYTDEDWQIIRAIFLVLRHAAGELKIVFAETGTVDFIEVAQIAKRVLHGEDQLPSDAAVAVADDIRHLLVDEFQDTSRRQHEFITSLIDAWPDRAGRTIFVVGDPMQSIYFFRDAEAELFRRVKENGFESGDGNLLPLHPVALKANFRTDPGLVVSTNEVFARVFAAPDGSDIDFESAEPARTPGSIAEKRFQLHLEFVKKGARGNAPDPDSRAAARAAQMNGIVSLIRSRLDDMDASRAAGRKYRIAILGRARSALTPIAEALRDAGIPFRAVELELLKDRPEILDAVALARALFNREDRIAWLGVLRAPWCGLSLAELHTIAGTDETRLPVPIPRLLRERIELLNGESRASVQRVLDAFDSFEHLRQVIPTAGTGTLLQLLWRILGGDRCVDSTARANLDLFWNLVDKLPGGEQDLLGAALDAALEDLCALPDAESSSDYGVQLMTIHKSKGLEFEVVIVPDLQAKPGQSRSDLLSWLERGLVEPDDSGELTEFLIAPLQFKGSEAGKAKRWVDRMRQERETQEARRILYVAATRAREELHLFAQPLYKKDRDESLVLLDPSQSLLATAWPAIGDEIRARFEAWKSITANAEDHVIPALAAAEETNVIPFPSALRPIILQRLPPDFEPDAAVEMNRSAMEAVVGLGKLDAYQRHEGGLQSRALGNAVHKLLEELARLRTTLEWNEARVALERLRPRIAASVRSAGISPEHADSIAAKALDIVMKASNDAFLRWIVSPHCNDASESGWAGVVAGSLRTVRVDRIFRAGLEPLQPGNDALWIIDYKTALADGLDSVSSLSELRAVFAPQLHAYAEVLRALHGDSTKLRAGLYYPRMSALDWWEI